MCKRSTYTTSVSTQITVGQFFPPTSGRTPRDNTCSRRGDSWPTVCDSAVARVSLRWPMRQLDGTGRRPATDGSDVPLHNAGTMSLVARYDSTVGMRILRFVTPRYVQETVSLITSTVARSGYIRRRPNDCVTQIVCISRAYLHIPPGVMGLCVTNLYFWPVTGSRRVGNNKPTITTAIY